MTERIKRPYYIMVSRKRTIAEIAVVTCLFIGILAAFQYANYVDRKSSSDLCGIINLSVNASKQNPRPTETQRIAAEEFAKIQRSYDCK